MVFKINKKIKKLLNRIIMEEHGQVLPLVLIILVLGSTLVAGTLTYASTTTKATSNSNLIQVQFYAADSSAREALWHFKYDYDDTVAAIEAGSGTWTYTPAVINNANLSNTLKEIADGMWQVISIATSAGSSTTVEMYLADYSVFFDNAAVASGEIRNKGVLVPADAFVEDYDHFPDPAVLAAYYSSFVEAYPAYNVLDTDTNPVIEENSRFTNGLTLTGSGILTLNDNIFVDGYFDLGNNDLDIILNGHTIYVAAADGIGPGEITAKFKTGLFGSGCIIAEGNITMFPNMEASQEGEFIFIMSVAGTIDLQPNSNFYGSVAAGGEDNQTISITMQPGTTVNSLGDYSGLDFPGWAISNWRSSRTALVTAIPPKGEINIGYSHTLTAIGNEPLTWSYTGSLPLGLTLDPTTGLISGTPTTDGTYNFTVTVTDSIGATATRTLSIEIAQEPDIYDDTMPDGQVDMYYAQDIGVNYGVRPFTWSCIVGDLPPGLSLNSETGVISGTPDEAAAGITYSFSIKVLDVLGGFDIQPLSITIVP